MRVTGTARWTRGLTMSAACLLFPTLAHAAAGGALPGNGAFVLSIVLLSVGCVALADRRRTLREIATLLVMSQPLFHTLLATGSHHRAAAIVPSAEMTVAHLSAALVLAVFLGGAESVAWSLAALSASALLVRVRRLVAGNSDGHEARPVLGPRWPTAHIRPLATVHIASSAPRRGPPLWTALACQRPN